MVATFITTYKRTKLHKVRKRKEKKRRKRKIKGKKYQSLHIINIRET